MATTYLRVSWKEYHSYALKLAATILATGAPIDEIVAISRGGLTLGHLFADLLNIPISTISIQSYTDIQEQGELKITATLQSSIKGKHILLVDDVSDSGKTLKRAVAYLKDLAPASLTTVTMFFKPQSVFRPDFFAKQSAAWIIFPYELRETIASLTAMLGKEGKTKAEIQKFLEKLEFEDQEIKFVWKHHEMPHS